LATKEELDKSQGSFEELKRNLELEKNAHNRTKDILDEK